MITFKKSWPIYVMIFIMAITSACGKGKKTLSSLKPLELTAWTTTGTDYTPGVKAAENIVENYLIQKTGVAVKNMFGNGGNQWDVKFTQLIANDNLPHIVTCGSGQGPAQFKMMKEADVLWGLTPEMLEKNAPHIYKRIPEEIWKWFTFDGKIYGIPFAFELSKELAPDISDEILQHARPNYNDVMTTRTGSFWIRDDILRKIYPEAKSYQQIKEILDQKQAPIGDELIDIPIKTTQDYLEFMYKLRDLNLTENGKAVYPMGLTNGDAWMPLAWFGSELMGYRGHQYITDWDEARGRMRVPILEPIVEQAALHINRMIRDKVIDPDSLLQTQSQYNEKVLNGEYVIVPSMWMNPYVTNGKLETAGKPFRFRPFYTQIPNAKGYEAFSQPPGWTQSVAIFKNVKEEDLAKILKWMDFMFTEEWEEVRYWGPKDAGMFEDGPDGTRKYTDERFQKFFIEGEASALQLQDRKGISTGTDPVGYFSMMMFTYSPKYHPNYYNKNFKYILSNDSGANFPSGSVHVQNVKAYPPCSILAPQFAGIEPAKKFLNSRTQWEDPFKLSLASKSDEEFKAKWEAAKKNLNTIFDVNQVIDEMTRAVKE